MKYLLVPFALAGFAAPLSARQSAESEQVKAALAALNDRADLPFQLTTPRLADATRALTGGALRVTAKDRRQAAADFVAANRDLLAVAPEIDVETRANGVNPRHVQIRFSHAGKPIDDASGAVSFHAYGRLGAVHSNAPANGTELGGFDVTQADAEASAAAALDAYRVRTGRTGSPTWRAAKSGQSWLSKEAGQDGLVPTWRVELATTRGDEAYAIWIDARDGTTRYVRELTTRTTGVFPNFGNAVDFKLGTAKGSAFANVAASLAFKSSTQSLKNWASTGIPTPVDFPKGVLTGARADIYDANNLNVFSATGNFIADFVNAPDDWDQSNAYFQIESNYAHLRANLGFDLQVNFSLPVIVNDKSTTPNAFFSQSTFPIDGHVDGFLDFFDLDQLVGPDGDFARDPGAVDHEHTHAWIFFEGESFEGALDEPTRAAGEGLADFFALCKQNDVRLGRYIDLIFPSLQIGRDQQGDAFFIDTLTDAIALGGTGMPEEHEAGKLLGTLTTDLRMRLGTKMAEQLVYQALPGMPNLMSDIGYNTVDTNNMIDAAADFLGTSTGALFNAAGFFSTALRTKIQTAVVGAATTRGILGSAESTFFSILDLGAQPRGLTTFTGAFIEPGQVQHYFFTAPIGSKLFVKLDTQKVGLAVHPDFVVVGAQGQPNPVTETAAPVFTPDFKSVSEKGIVLELATGTVYDLQIVSTNGVQGTYTLTLDI